MIAEQGQFEGSDWLSAVHRWGLAGVSDVFRWTAAEDSLWSFLALEPKLSKLNDTVCQKQSGHTGSESIVAALAPIWEAH